MPNHQPVASIYHTTGSYGLDTINGLRMAPLWTNNFVGNRLVPPVPTSSYSCRNRYSSHQMPFQGIGLYQFKVNAEFLNWLLVLNTELSGFQLQFWNARDHQLYLSMHGKLSKVINTLCTRVYPVNCRILIVLLIQLAL